MIDRYWSVKHVLPLFVFVMIALFSSSGMCGVVAQGQKPSQPEARQFQKLLMKQLQVRKWYAPIEGWRLDVDYLEVKGGWAYLVGGLRVLVDGAWEEPNDGGIAALFRKQGAKGWTIVDWGRYGPEEERNIKFAQRVRTREKAGELPTGLLPKDSLLWPGE